MSTIRFKRSHDLGADRVREIAESVVADLQADFGGTYHWQGSVLHFDRTGISGSLSVDEHSLALDLSLGMMMRPLRSRIESLVADRLDTLLGETGQGSSSART